MICISALGGPHPRHID